MVYILLTRIQDQFGCLFSKVMEFEKPSGVFLDTSLWLARTKWGEENGTHLGAKDDDWAFLYKTEKLDQWLVSLVHHPLSRRMMVSCHLPLWYRYRHQMLTR